MKKLSLFATLALATLAMPAWSAEMASGFVKKLDPKLMKVTIKHEPLKNLDMGAMTMVFAIKDEAVLKKLKAGATIKFAAERVNGRLTVVEVQ